MWRNPQPPSQRVTLISHHKRVGNRKHAFRSGYPQTLLTQKQQQKEKTTESLGTNFTTSFFVEANSIRIQRDSTGDVML
jgi:hypothetical protein